MADNFEWKNLKNATTVNLPMPKQKKQADWENILEKSKPIEESDLKKFMKSAVSTVVPTVGQIGGAVVGSVADPFIGPAGTLAGAGLGYHVGDLAADYINSNLIDSDENRYDRTPQWNEMVGKEALKNIAVGALSNKAGDLLVNKTGLGKYLSEKFPETAKNIATAVEENSPIPEVISAAGKSVATPLATLAKNLSPSPLRSGKYRNDSALMLASPEEWGKISDNLDEGYIKQAATALSDETLPEDKKRAMILSLLRDPSFRQTFGMTKTFRQ